MISLRHSPGVFALVVLTLFASQSGYAEINLARYRSLAECDKALQIYPDEIDVCHCYVNIAEREREWGKAIDHLRDRLDVTPDDPRLLYSLGLVDASRGGDEAEDSLNRSADRFAALGIAKGEVQALLSLFMFHRSRAGQKDADATLERAERTADGSDQAELQHFVLFHRGTQAFGREEYVQANRLYTRVEAEVFPNGHPVLQGMVLSALASQAAWEGRHREAIERLERAVVIFHRIGDYTREASVQYKLAEILKTMTKSGGASEETYQLALLRARDAAERGRNQHVKLWILHDEAFDPPLGPEPGLAKLRLVCDLAREIGEVSTEARSLRSMANTTAGLGAGHFDAAFRLADEAIAVGQRAASSADTAYGYVARALLHRRQRDRDAALTDWELALDEIESIRDRQRDDLVQARQTNRWAFTYYRLFAYIMEGEQEQAALADIDRALRIAERLRARVTLETLDDARAITAPDSAAAGQRSQVLADLARVQRALVRKDIDEPERAGLLSRLSQLEAEETALRARIALSDQRFASLRAPDFPSLAELQLALEPDEALLSFSIGAEASITPWLIVVTNAQAHAYKLPPGPRIENAVTLFMGLLDRRDGQETTAAEELHEMLLASATATLPAGTRRLIIVPDGPLHRLPIDLLRDRNGVGPLADHYDLSIVPSLTAWRRWRTSAPSDAPLPLLALSDPGLPLAREESATVAGLLGRGSQIREGEDASESFLKAADPHAYALLHIAAHAVLDDQHPQRSAILLAPGSPDEDGLLQMREITSLDLRDRTVVLSACSSASGTVLQGAGVMGIARAFFHSGARAVVGSLLPLRDDEAEQAISRFALHLSDGASVAAALARARRDIAASGAPAAAWAGLVVMGDGDLVPFPGGVGRISWYLLPGMGAAALIAFLWLLVRGWRRSRTVSVR